MKKLISLVLVSVLGIHASVLATSGEFSTGATGGMQPQVIVTTESSLVTVQPPKRLVKKPAPRYLTLQKFFVDTCNRLGDGMPLVYKDIDIYRPNVSKGTKLHTALQKCAYLGVVEKRGRVTNFQVPVKGDFVYNFLSSKLYLPLEIDLEGGENVDIKTRETRIRGRIPTYRAIQNLLQLSSFGANSIYESPVIRSQHFPAFSSIFSQLINNYHYLSGGANDENLLYGAIQGMVDSLHDEYSVYFPPQQSTDFYGNIQGTYYGVGMYIDVRDGKCVVGATMPGAPASLAGLQAGDVIIAVDGWSVPDTFSLNDITSRIKGPVDTQVTIDVQRGNTMLSFTITRKKIIIPMMEVDTTNRTVMFTINSFGQGLTSQFNEAINVYQQHIQNASTIIIDVRSNPGGYLEEAAGILGFFVPEGMPVVVMEHKNHTEDVLSEGYSSIFSGKQLYLLINGGSASASEILVATLKDYMPSAKIIGEQSFGKGSAQSVVGLPNGGSVKYTVALWKTGKTRSSIEGVGIKPDIQLVDDPRTSEDEVLLQVLN